MTPQTLKDYWELVAGLFAVAGSVISGAVLLVWRASKWFHTLETAEKERAKAAGELKEAVTRLTGDTAKVQASIVKLEGVVERHGVDSAKLEGRIQQLADSGSKTTSALERTIGSLDAVWRTLQNLHPTKVPRRASENGPG